ncbi:MAG: right-handed parallel beta-helix repeat-containing protein [Eubacterium sp.]|nr:right-handed parallel beta-helix repeat-containing protein [Eubacterium sp.]
MSKKAGFLSVTLLAGLVAGNLGAVPMNVYAKGNDSNVIVVEPSSNKKDTPITNALKQAKDGTVIYLKSGEYHEQLVIDKSNVTIKGLTENGQKAYINGEGLFSSSNDVVIKVKGSNVVIDNIEIKNFKSKGPSNDNVPIGIKVYDGVSRVKISNCDIHDMGVNYTNKKSDDYNGHGILVTGYDSEKHTSKGVKTVVINNCHLYNLTLGNSEAMVLNGNVEDFYVYDNVVENCDNIGIDFIGYENVEDINKKAKSNKTELAKKDSARNGYVYNNVVRNISSGSNCTYHGEKCAGGIYVDGGHDIEIHDNYVEKSDIGIELASEHAGQTTDNITLTNNVLYKNNALAGISIGGSFDDEHETGYATNCKVTHNTVYNEDGTAFNIQRANDSSNKVTNNVFYAKSNANLYENEKKYKNNTIEKNLVNKNEGPASSKNSKDTVDTSMKVSVDSSAMTASVSSKSYTSDFGGVITWSTTPSLNNPTVTVPAFDDAAAEPEITEPEVTTPEVQDPVIDNPSEDVPSVDVPGADDNNNDNPVVNESAPVESSDEEPSWDIHSDSTFYTIDESDGTCKITFKKKKSENWKHVNVDFGNVDLSKYSTVKLTVVPSRKNMNLGITNQDEDNPIFYRNHWNKEGKFTSSKKATISVALTEENKNGIYLYFDATSNDTYTKSQTVKITDIWFE